MSFLVLYSVLRDGVVTDLFVPVVSRFRHRRGCIPSDSNKYLRYGEIYLFGILFLSAPWSVLALMGEVTLSCDGYRKYSALGLVARLRGNGGLRDSPVQYLCSFPVVLSHAGWGDPGVRGYPCARAVTILFGNRRLDLFVLREVLYYQVKGCGYY